MKSLEKLRNLESITLLDSEKQKVIGGEVEASLADVLLYYCYYKNINSGDIISRGPYSSRNGGITCPYYSGYFKCTRTGQQI